MLGLYKSTTLLIPIFEHTEGQIENLTSVPFKSSFFFMNQIYIRSRQNIFFSKLKAVVVMLPQPSICFKFEGCSSDTATTNKI